MIQNYDQIEENSLFAYYIYIMYNRIRQSQNNIKYTPNIYIPIRLVCPSVK